MNRLKVRDNSNNIFLGKMPHTLEDMDWQDKSVREAFYGLMSALGVDPETSFIISGCNVSGGAYTAGYICLNGEILKVDAGVVPTPSGANPVYWDVVQTFDSLGSKMFANGATHDTYEIRKGALVTGVAPAHYMPMANGNIWDRVATGLGSKIISRSKIIKQFKTATAVAVATTEVPIIGPYVPILTDNCSSLTINFTCSYTASNAAVVDLIWRIKKNGVLQKQFLDCSIDLIGGARNFAMLMVIAYTAGESIEVTCECVNLNLTVNEATCLVEGLMD